MSYSLCMSACIPLYRLFSIPIEHTLPSASPWETGSPRTVHSLTSSIHAVLHLLGKHFPVISPSITFITKPSLLLLPCPCLANLNLFSCSCSICHSGAPIIYHTQTFVPHSVHLIRITLSVITIQIP